MTRSATQAWLVCSIAMFAFAGCASDTTSSESTGALSLNLEVVPGIEIDEVDWTISSPGMDDMSGTINTSAPGSTASVEVFGLPPGDDYNVELEAMSEDGTTCRGDADFEVEVGETTVVMVFLNCKRPETLGGVRVNGDFNICAELAKVIVSPLQTSVGNDIDLSAIGQDVEGDSIQYLWTGTGGSIDDPTADETTYECEELGDQLITITVSDDDFDYCMHSWAVPVTCVEGDGPECVGDDDCDEGFVCEDFECVPDVECTNDDDCDAGFVCEEFECVPDVECNVDDDCDAGFVCENFECVPDVECNEDDDCDAGFVCEEFECVPDVECNEDADCGLDQVCIANACYGDPDLFCNENLCDIDDDARADCIQTFILCVEGEPADEEGCAVLARLKCNECNEDSDCDAGEVCSENKLCVPAPLDCEYIQDFESLDQESPTALSDDGWLVFANVFNADGSYAYGYGTDPAPNNTGAFSGIVLNEGGAEQGIQQLVIISDYNNREAQESGQRVEANTFQERVITAEDVGKTLTFSFDAKRGNINNPTGSSTANGFIKTLDPNAGFATTNFIPEDTTNLPDTWNRYTIQLPIDAGLVGQLLQVGFSATATNDEPSGNFYDNIDVCFSEDNGGGECVPPALPNLTINGDFETGDFCGWTNFCDNASCTITDQNPNSGEFAANVNVANANQAGVIKQFLIGEGEVQAGDALDISLFIRGEVGAGGLLFVTLFSELPDGGVTDRKDFGPFFPTADWVEIPISTTVGGDPSGGITLELAAQSGASFINLFVDDVSVVIVDP